MSDRLTLQKLVSCGGMVRLPRETFCIDYPILVPSGTVIDGCGAIIATELDTKHTLWVRGREDVTIRNLTIQGGWAISSGDPATIGAAIQIQESRNVAVENVKIRDMMGRGIVAASNVDDLTIRGCHIRNCAISVFLFKGIRASILESNRIFDSRIMGIYVDDATEGDTQETAVPNHLTIVRGNIIVGGGTSPRNTGVGIAASASTDTIISENIVRCFGSETRIGHGIILNNGQGEFHKGKRTVVTGNILSEHTGYGLYVVDQESFIESGNVYAGNGLGDFKLIGAIA